MCEKLLPICTFFIVSFVTVVYAFVFQNIIIEERNLYVFKIIRANWSFCFFLSLNFRVLSPEIFNPYCQLAICSQNSMLSLPIDGINYFLMALKFPFSETSSSTAVFFLTMMWQWHQALIKKSSETFFLIPLSPFNSVTTWWCVEVFLII